MSALLLDTHVWLWLTQGIEDKLPKSALQRIDVAAQAGCLYLSTISVWETGMLVAKQRLRLPKPHQQWILAALNAPGLRVLGLEPEIALAANDLPGEFHADPADRILAASGRYLAAPLMTHDRKIIAYAEQGHLAVDAI
jgi:PIN domain nuclease of toxin-antitoxin system